MTAPSRAETIKKGAIVLALGTIVAGLGVTAALRPHPHAQTDLGGLLAPALTLPVVRLDRGPTQARLGARDFAGKPLLVHFWAPSCQPCVAEFPIWQTAFARSQQEGFGVLAIAGDDLQGVQDFLRAGHYTLPVVLDASGQAFMAWRVTAMPTTIAVSSDGHAVQVVEGAVDQAGLTQLLAAARGASH